MRFGDFLRRRQVTLGKLRGRHVSYGVRLKVSGRYACFTAADGKVERQTYPVMTPSAARGIIEAVHWRPAIRYIVDAIHVLSPIRFATIRRNEVGGKVPANSISAAMKRGRIEGLSTYVDEDRQQRTSTVLVDPAYFIEAHIELTEKAGADDNIGKHLDMFRRRAERGQCFNQPSLGTREFVADFEWVSPDDRPPKAIDDSRDLGLMLWDIEYRVPGRPSRLFWARLESGVMRVPAPGSPEVL